MKFINLLPETTPWNGILEGFQGKSSSRNNIKPGIGELEATPQDNSHQRGDSTEWHHGGDSTEWHQGGDSTEWHQGGDSTELATVQMENSRAL